MKHVDSRKDGNSLGKEPALSNVFKFFSDRFPGFFIELVLVGISKVLFIIYPRLFPLMGLNQLVAEW
ncbi:MULTISPECIES: hypothetical protein [unclassified Paraflavitalea]|uniref:hypothetical protein n=1 Tax=unclassified Paraflavitalea TaxID=2798305 RepID=UPI003D337831